MGLGFGLLSAQLRPGDSKDWEQAYDETLRLARVVDDLGNLAEAELPQILRPTQIDLASVATQAAEARRALEVRRSSTRHGSGLPSGSGVADVGGIPTRERIGAGRRGFRAANQIVIDRAEGDYVWDMDGKRYIDFQNGWATNPVGNCHPEVLEAVEAANRTYGFHYDHPLRYELAERLATIMPGPLPRFSFEVLPVGTILAAVAGVAIGNMNAKPDGMATASVIVSTRIP